RMLQATLQCFFQAEDGIRDFHVTGVQTCALPILDDVGDYLAELRYIDLAQQHIVQRNHEYAADGTASGTNLIQVRLGTQYPFMKIGRASCRERGEGRGCAA